MRTFIIKNDHFSPIIQEKTIAQRVNYVVKLVLRIIFLLLCLYFFVVSLELMTSGFRLAAGHDASQIFKSDLLTNPLACLVMGVLATVLVQSSSTATSIVG
jgi:sodium-dependent phosphate cotransporter